MKKIISKSDIIFVAVILIGLIGSIFIPTVGTLVLIDELCNTLMIAGLGAWLLKISIVIFKDKDFKSCVWTGLLAVVILFFGFLTTKDVVLDTMNGSSHATLSNCSVEKRSTTKGIISLDCYLNGEDENGEELTLKISLSDYDKLNNKSTVSVQYYENTQRIIKY